MIIRKAVSSATLIAVRAVDLAGISTDGAMICFDLSGATEDWSAEDMRAIVDGWDEAVGIMIADTDSGIEIACLTALKRAIADLHQDITRESYMHDRRVAEAARQADDFDDEYGRADATDSDTGSHPTQTGDASISLSSQQHGADRDEKEEIAHGTQQEEADRGPRRRSAGRG